MAINIIPKCSYQNTDYKTPFNLVRVQMTLRDDAWDAALDQLVETQEFNVSELPFKQSEMISVNRILQEMEARSWLQKESEHSQVWRPGPKAKLLMDISDEEN